MYVLIPGSHYVVTWLAHNSESGIDSNCPLLLQRITACSTKGFSAVVLDDVSDQGDTPNGFNLTTADYRNHTSFLSSQATALNMQVGIMGGTDLISDAAWAAQFDFAVAVACFSAGTCAAWSGFTAGEVCFMPILVILPMLHTASISNSVLTKWCISGLQHEHGLTRRCEWMHK
jgi:hypothetical protein